ncbi:MAG TPA: hypothetical protein VMW38_28760, partial [Terriglobia bacterium]|nr:hypothetical protein [Terriglobia bacterium]
TAGDVFGHSLDDNFRDQGWQSFQAALDVRDGLTHPKTFEDCHVDDDALETVDQGHAWFKDLHNEFVRVAHLHRNREHSW